MLERYFSSAPQAYGSSQPTQSNFFFPFSSHNEAPRIYEKEVANKKKKKFKIDFSLKMCWLSVACRYWDVGIGYQDLAKDMTDCSHPKEGDNSSARVFMTPVG